MLTEIQEHFSQEKYVVLRGFLNPETCKILYKYCCVKSKAMQHKMQRDPHLYHKNWDGSFGDTTLDEAYAIYGDPMGDSILDLAGHDISACVGTALSANYSYWRVYYQDNELIKHTDRPSCEISTTLCLGYDTSNLDDDYVWPIYLQNPLKKTTVEVKLEPGDLIVYKGCDLVHWRDPFKGINHAQLFCHYHDANGPHSNNLLLDGRPILGVAARIE